MRARKKRVKRFSIACDGDRKLMVIRPDKAIHALDLALHASQTGDEHLFDHVPDMQPYRFIGYLADEGDPFVLSVRKRRQDGEVQCTIDRQQVVMAPRLRKNARIVSREGVEVDRMRIGDSVVSTLTDEPLPEWRIT